MTAVSRLRLAILGAVLAAGASAALAQDSARQVPPTGGTAAAPVETVGPRDLQGFSLKGTVTRPAEAASSEPVRTARGEVPPPATTATAAQDTARPAVANDAPPRPVGRLSQAPAPNAALGSPASATPLLPAMTPAPLPAAAPIVSGAAADIAADRPDLPLWPWVLAGVLGAAAAAWFALRSRRRAAFAGGPQSDQYAAPSPPAAPPPQPEVKPAATPSRPAGKGIVSTRLRPWIDIGFEPLHAAVDGDQVAIDFQLDLFNSGSAPARAVLAEIVMFNAGAEQDQAIAGFFAQPAEAGERIALIEPLSRVTLRHQVTAPRANLQEYEVAGRRMFVPILAFNATYAWSGGEGRTSAAYLVGTATRSDKVGPLRLDLGTRSYRAVAARVLPPSVRR